MSALFTGDNITLGLALLAAAGMALLLCRTEPGWRPGGPPTGRHARPADAPRQPRKQALVSHAAPRCDRPAKSPMSAVVTVPDGGGPFAARHA